MYGEVEEPKYVVLVGNSDHTVRPMRSGFSFSRQSKSAYPFLTWMPKCARYHAAIAFGSRAFMNTPPMPVTFSISAAFLMLSCDEDRVDQRQPAAKSKAPRSEEHTSELQSRRD